MQRVDSPPLKFKVERAPKKRGKKKEKIPTEHWEQVQVVKYMQESRMVFVAVPNGGSRGPIEGARLKAEGVQKGFPDLLVLHPFLGAIEMKKTKGGRVSPEQTSWLQTLEDIGFKCVVAKGHEEAIKFIEECIDAET